MLGEFRQTVMGKKRMGRLLFIEHNPLDKLKTRVKENSMSIIIWLVLGLIAGWIANMIMSSGQGGLIADILLGIVGAVVGGFLSSLLLGIDVTGFNLTSILISVVGAIVVIAIYRAITRQSVRL
jgi:uncharacterized membrane protein YeaQ/YmgE (transglycosylase-associated protein family)